MAEARIQIVLSNGKVAGETLKDLAKDANRLNKEIKDLKPGTEQFVAKSKDLQQVNARLKEVKDQIVELLRRRKASELALKDGQAKLERLKKGEDAGVSWGPPKTVSRRDAQGLPGDVLRRVVSADVSKLPAYVGMPIPDAGYRLLRISKVTDVEPQPMDAQAAQRIAGMVGNAQYAAYLESLRSRADIEVRASNLETK